MAESIDKHKRNLLVYGLGVSALTAAPRVLANDKYFSASNIVIVGAGAAGIAIANRLNTRLQGGKITIVGERPQHFYQPGYTLIASGLWPESRVTTTTAEWLPSGVQWLNLDALSYQPEKNQLRLTNGQSLTYDILIIATGCQLNYGDIEGMSEGLIGTQGIGSVYASTQAAKATSVQIDQLLNKGSGKAIFTLSDTPIKCAGAPLKMTFTTLSRMESSGKRDNFDVQFHSPFANRVFSVPEYNAFVLQRWQEQQVTFNDVSKLIAIDAGTKQAVFLKSGGKKVTESYDFIHVVPPMSAPDSVRNSDLVWQSGSFSGQWLDVDQYNLQHNRFNNVFGIGDVIGTPFGKTAASVKKQAPVVEENVLSYLKGVPLTAKYDGYTSCPLITSIGRAILAEFGYGGEIMPSFSFIDPMEESWAVWVMKEQMLQPAYYAMLDGKV